MSVSWALLDESWTPFLFFLHTLLAVTLLSEVCSADWKYFFFLHLTMNWNESINLFISSWIDYYQNDYVSMWEQVGLHQVQTLQVLSEPFFLITAGISRSSAAGRELKIDGTTAARLWQSCVFLTCFWRKRPPCKKKKKKEHKFTLHNSYDRIFTNSSASLSADWQPVHLLLTNSWITNCVPGTLCMVVPGVNRLSRP